MERIAYFKAGVILPDVQILGIDGIASGIFGSTDDAGTPESDLVCCLDFNGTSNKDGGEKDGLR